MTRVVAKPARKGEVQSTVPCKDGCGRKVDAAVAHGLCRHCFRYRPPAERQPLLAARTRARRSALKAAEEEIHRQRCAEDLARFLANCRKCREPLTVPHRRDSPLT